MKTITSNKFIITAVGLVILCSGARLSGQYDKISGFTASVHLEYFSPQQDIVKEIYGENAFPVNFQLGFKINRRLAVFTGIRYMTLSGETGTNIQLGNSPAQEVTLSVVSIPFGFNYHMTRTKLCPFVGGGGMYFSYNESWENDQFEFKDSKVGFFLQGGIQYELSKKLLILVMGQFISMDTKVGNPSEPNIRLGGYAAALGFTYRFF